LYLPGPWLREGGNEVVVLDLTGPQEARLAGLSQPILDRLQPGRDLARPLNTIRPALDGVTPVHEADFAPGPATQDVRFAAPVKGRYFCLEALSGFDGKDAAAIAEIALLDTLGRPLNQSNWTIAYASSEEMSKEDGSALNAINGQTGDYWHTAYSDKAALPVGPHRLIVDLGEAVEIGGLRYTPRQGPEGVSGRVRHYRVYVGDGLVMQ
jgi:beta-galactosidase